MKNKNQKEEIKKNYEKKMTNQNQDKIYIEKEETIRLIVQQQIGLEKVLDKLNEKFKVNRWQGENEIIIFVEEKDKD